MIAILTPFSQISCLDRSVPTSRPPTRPTQPVAAALLVSGTPTYNYIVTDQRQVAAQQLQSCTAFHHLNYVSTGAKGRARNSIHTGEKKVQWFWVAESLFYLVYFYLAKSQQQLIPSPWYLRPAGPVWRRCGGSIIVIICVMTCRAAGAGLH